MSLGRILKPGILLPFVGALALIAGARSDGADLAIALDGDPVAKFDFAPVDPREGDIIQFIDLSYDTNGEIESREWTINGETTTLQNPFYLFEDEGLYSASLTVTDNDGVTSTVSTGDNAADGDPVRPLQVTNAAPLVNALEVETLQGEPAVLRGRFVDAGVPDVHSAEWQIAGNPVATVEEENDPMLSTGFVTGELTTDVPVSGVMEVDDGEGGTASDFFVVTPLENTETQRERHEPNGAPGQQVLYADKSYISFLQEQGDIDLFEVKQVDNQEIRAGSEILATLSGLPADYDIALLAEAPAGVDTAGYSRLGLSTLGYSRLGFSATGESALGYSRLGYSRLGYSRLGYSRLGYSRLGLASFGTSGVSWADMGYSRLGYSRLGYSRLGNDVTAIDVTLDDIGLNGIPGDNLNVADFSAARGISDETAWARSTVDGTRFYVVVFGANEAHSFDDPYSLSLEIIEPPEIDYELGAACDGSPLITDGTTSATVTLHNYNDPGTGGDDPATSLFVIQEQRFRAIHDMDQAEWDAFMAQASTLAQQPNVRGDVISLPSDIYDNWDSNPCSVDAANSVVTQIRDIVQAPEYDGVEHLQLLGDDRVVPYRRVQDHAIIGNEKDYLIDSLLTPGSPLYIAILQGYMLSDHFLADEVLDPWQGGDFAVPEKAIGRLVETPQEISDAMQAFIDSGGILAPETALVTGYDFFDDGSTEIADNLASGLGDVDPLIADTWTADDLRCRMLDDGPAPGWDDSANPDCRAPDIAAPNAHYTHYAGLSANGFETDNFADALMADDVANAGGGIPVLGGSIVFTMGCHAGFNAPDGQTAAAQDDFDPALDFPQAAARQNAIWIASTGFGIGDDEGIAGTEEIMGMFADRLVNSGLTAGEAHAQTLRDYVLAQSPLTVYDVKSAIQTTYYGLTMYAVQPQAMTTLSAAMTAAENIGYQFSLTTVDPASDVPTVVTNHSLNPNTTPKGDYYDLDGDQQATIGRAVQPRGVFDLEERHPYTTPPPPVNGLIVTGGTYVTLDEFDALTSRRKFEWERGVTEPQECLLGFSPAQPLAVNSLRDVSDLEQALVVIPGQFRCTSGASPAVEGVERLWNTMAVELRRCETTTDLRGPVIHRVDIQGVAGASVLTVKASDESGLARIVALRIAGGNVVSFQETLAGELEGEFEMTIPSSGLPQEELYLQVEDVNCNTSVHTAKAGYLKAINVNAGPDRQFAAGLATFTATITGFTALNDDVVFVWDFGDGTSMTGVLSPTGQSTVPVTVNPDGSATFTVTHMYSGTPVPSMATVRIDDGLGGTGSDDVLFGAECDPDKWGDHGGGDTGHGQDDDDDLDCDGFPTKPRTGGRGSEEFIGTDATDPCPDDEADAAWPPDFNNSGGVSLSDVVGFGQHYNKSSQQQGYSQRFDLNASGGINLSDIVVLGPFFNRDCEPG